MNNKKHSIPRGTRDFSPAETARRNYIFDTVRGVFALYGYGEIETPAMETLGTLTGKYGDEGDKLLFRVLDSGNFLADVSDEEIATRDARMLSSRICGKGLRYDLTVPFARYVAMHRDEIVFPFRRCQIQPVWRADKPQHGRYREFCQCDADIVGSDSLLCEGELLRMADDVFTRLGLRVEIKMNNRKVLAGMAEAIGAADKLTAVTVAIDKLEKAGKAKVEDELRACGLNDRAIRAIGDMLAIDGSNDDKLNAADVMLKDNATGLRGIDEARAVIAALADADLNNNVTVDFSLARGLDYYTGAIFEVKALDTPMGSISGGGRYDNLTGVFGLPGMSGVGISFGADRIYDVLGALNLFPKRTVAGTQLLFVNFGRDEALCAMAHAAAMRQAGIRTEVYPDTVKTKKQMAYANAKGIPFVALVGTNEMAEGSITLKDMTTGGQKQLSRDETINTIKKATDDER